MSCNPSYRFDAIETSMKNMKKIQMDPVNNLIILVFAAALSGVTGFASAQETRQLLSSYEDCTEIDLRFDDLNQPVTASERSELRRREIIQSLNKSDNCKKSSENAGGGGGSGRGDGSAGNTSGTGTSAQGMAGAATAVASTTMAGTELSATQPETERYLISDEQIQSAESPSRTSPSSRTTQIAGVGRAPLDIPPVATDDLVAQQLREAAMRQTDPEKQQQLWDTYRQYKGIKVK